MELSGRIVRINRGSLQYSLKNSKSASESIVMFELYETNGQTIVSVTDDVDQGNGAEDRYNRIKVGIKY